MHVLINGKDNSSWNSAMSLVRAVTRVNTKGQPIVYAYIALKKNVVVSEIRIYKITAKTGHASCGLPVASSLDLCELRSPKSKV